MVISYILSCQVNLRMAYSKVETTREMTRGGSGAQEMQSFSANARGNVVYIITKIILNIQSCPITIIIMLIIVVVAFIL